MLRDYYKAGGHVYEISRGRGKRKARICFAETPDGDGEILWAENAEEIFENPAHPTTIEFVAWMDSRNLPHNCGVPAKWFWGHAEPADPETEFFVLHPAD